MYRGGMRTLRNLADALKEPVAKGDASRIGRAVGGQLDEATLRSLAGPVNGA